MRRKHVIPLLGKDPHPVSKVRRSESDISARWNFGGGALQIDVRLGSSANPFQPGSEPSCSSPMRHLLRLLGERHRGMIAMPFSTPVATYRLQLRNGVDLDRAIGLLPWLRHLGVSPPFSALSSGPGIDSTATM
ncbi:hypothetical protein ACFSHP_20760 [Novosphingobium panipatense]